MQSTSQSNESDDAAWIQIAPLLDDAMTGLGQKDHDALVCRYFEGRSFTEVASQLGTTEAGAKMRVNRGLEKLRKFFSARGVRFSAWAIAGAMSAHSVQAASNTLAAQVTSAALQGTFVTTTTSTLVEKTLNYMTWIKIKSATALAVAGMLAVGTTGVIVQQSRAAATVSAQAGSVSYATPEATLNSLIAAMKASDTKLFAAGCTKSKAEQFNRQNAGKTKEQLENESSAMAKAFSVYEILRKTAVSDTVVLLHVNAKGKSPNAPAGDRNLAMRMVKVGKDWKFDGEQQ